MQCKAQTAERLQLTPWFHTVKVLREDATMKFTHKKFDVPVIRQVNPALTSWPKPEDVSDDCHPGGNRDYCDLRGLSWMDAREVQDLEHEYIQRIEQAPLPSGTGPFGEEDLFDDIELAEITGIDIGVASTVAVLSASGFIPCTSCNGGAFGGRHHEQHPLVAFYAYPEAIPLLLKCAEASGVGLDNDQGWAPDDLPIVVYADDVRNMRAFANELSKQFGPLNLCPLTPERCKENRDNHWCEFSGCTRESHLLNFFS